MSSKKKKKLTDFFHLPLDRTFIFFFFFVTNIIRFFMKIRMIFDLKDTSGTHYCLDPYFLLEE